MIMMENATNNPAIRLRGLTKSFGEQKVLDRIDLEIARGETMTILGRSGTGKSVMLKLIIGLQKPDGGEIELNGKEITSLTLDDLNRVRKTIGFLFQSAALYDSLNVEENVAFPIRRHTRMDDDERQARVRGLLARVGMEEAARKMPSDISGGMKKRVGLARALALDPEIMLLDEPTAGLDPITAGEINELIRELQKEREVSSVVVTHDIRSLRTVADRVALLNEGSIVIEGTLEDLKQSNDPFVSKFMHESGEVT
jgi:phospholipid/cholesterol/gamma-HCH transport system ATP-binding protein